MTLTEATTPLPLVDEHGRYSRAAVTQRAQDILAAGNTVWAAALSRAYREASDELRVRFGRVTTIPIRKVAHV